MTTINFNPIEDPIKTFHWIQDLAQQNKMDPFELLNVQTYNLKRVPFSFALSELFIEFLDALNDYEDVSLDPNEQNSIQTLKKQITFSLQKQDNSPKNISEPNKLLISSIDELLKLSSSLLNIGLNSIIQMTMSCCFPGSWVIHHNQPVINFDDYYTDNVVIAVQIFLLTYYGYIQDERIFSKIQKENGI